MASKAGDCEIDASHKHLSLLRAALVATERSFHEKTRFSQRAEEWEPSINAITRCREIQQSIYRAEESLTISVVPKDQIVDAAFTLALALLEHGCYRYPILIIHATTIVHALCDIVPATHPGLQDISSNLTIIAQHMRIEMLAGGDSRKKAALDCAKRIAKDAPASSSAEVLALYAVSRFYDANIPRTQTEAHQYLRRALASMQRATAKESLDPNNAILMMLRTEDACLHLENGHIVDGLEVWSAERQSIISSSISLANIMPCRFRFIHCQSFVTSSTIRLLAFDNLPKYQYAAISYVWKGLAVDDEAKRECDFMVVKGSEDADPISMAVLRSACVAALRRGCELIWLDRLGIMQENANDKTWQIRNMFSIYKYCRICLILPGGLMRLARIDDETSWMDRAWTLQEAAAPRRRELILAWESGSSTQVSSPMPIMSEVEPGRSAVTDLEIFLQTTGRTVFIHTERGDQPGWVNKVIGDGRDTTNMYLHSVLATKTTERSLAIWRAAFLRTSSRPVDMVFSIMGLFGVELDPSRFHSTDRLGALVELMRAVLARGERVCWLGMFPDILPHPTISWLPVLPTTSVSGAAFISSPEGLLTKENEAFRSTCDWYLESVPFGAVDKHGCLIITTKAVPVQKVEGKFDKNGPIVQYPSLQVWSVCESPSQSEQGTTASSECFCLFIGYQESSSLGYLPTRPFFSAVCILVCQSVPGRWLSLGGAIIESIILETRGCISREFTIGGLPGGSLGR